MTTDNTSNELWEKAKSIYLSTIGNDEEKSQVERYLSMIVSVECNNDCFSIYTSSAFSAEFLKANYSERLKKCLELVTPTGKIDLEFKFRESSIPSIMKPIPKAERRPKVSTFVSTMPLNEEYTFDEFVRGPSNSFALAAAQAVVANPGRGGFNPLFIHGGTGLGKTHLMQAIGNELRKRDPSLAICYLTAEEYLNEYVNYMKDQNIPGFRAKYRSVDVLLLDDVQFLQKGKQIQEEFFNTFNALKDNRKQIVMTSDLAPKNLPSIEQRLVSRFEGGMLQEIETPSYETRLAILKKKAEGLEVSVPDYVLEFIADKIKSHVRAMEGALGKVSVYLSAYPASVLSNEALDHLLGDFIQKEQTMKKLNIDEIQEAVAKKFSVTMEQLLSPERTQSVVTPRQLAMYIARKFTPKSLPEIAKQFEKTHATIIHGVRNIEKRLDVEADLKASLAEILAEFGYKLSDRMD
jgi:chromosomal replication initiator protein